MRMACAVALLAHLTIFSAPLRVDGVQSLAPVERLAPAVREPIGVAVKEDGAIFVADHAAGAILELLPGDRTRPVVTGLSKPWGLATDPDGRLLIAEEYGRLLRVDDDHSLTTLAARLYRPRWIAGDGRTVYTSAAGLRYPHTLLPGGEPAVGQAILRRTPDGLVLRIADGFLDAPAVVVTADALYAVGETLATATEPEVTLVLRLPLGADGEAGAPEVLARATAHAPAGLAIDRLGALFFVALPGAATSTRSVLKLLPDGRLVTFASELSGAQGLALEPDGHMLVAVQGTVPGLLRFLAPDAPDVTPPAPAATAITTITGTAEAGGLIAVHRARDGHELLAVSGVDTTGHFAVAVPLETNTTNAVEVTVVGAQGDGLASRAAAVSIVHDDRPPVVSLGPALMPVLRGTVELSADAHDEGSTLRALTLYVDTRVIGLVESIEPAGTLRVTASLDTFTLGDGAHTIRVVAEDHAGNTASDVRTAIVDNAPPEAAIALGQIRTIRDAVAALLRAGECSWGTSCLGWGSDGFHGIDILVGFGHLPPEYDGNINPWRGPYGVIGGVDGYAIKVHGLPPGPVGDAACRDLAAALAGQARSTSCSGGWDQKLFEAGFPNP